VRDSPDSREAGAWEARSASTLHTSLRDLAARLAGAREVAAVWSCVQAAVAASGIGDESAIIELPSDGGSPRLACGGIASAAPRDLLDAAEAAAAHRRGVLGAEISAAGRVQAVLVARAAAPRAWTEAGTDLLGAFAVLAGMALERLDAVSRARDGERALLATRLHDGAGQTLVALKLRCEDLAAGAPPSVGPPLLAIGAIAGLALEELQRLTCSLRAPEIGRLGLAGALQALAERLSGRELSVHLHIEPAELPAVDPHIGEELYRVAQAALTNVARHARARAAFVTLVADRGALCLSVEDDGVGFEPATVMTSAGLGLASIRERVAGLGGELALWSSPGRGARLDIVIGGGRGEGS
jgi:signal transduction histidine kinase